eukprot:8880791-Ditylum_brightwellii.AAC.1
MSGKTRDRKIICHSYTEDYNKKCKSTIYDVASAPTGCAATLISGITHYRLFKMPTGKVLTSVPCDRSNTLPLLKQKWIASWMKYFY